MSIDYSRNDYQSNSTSYSGNSTISYSSKKSSGCGLGCVMCTGCRG